MRRARSYMMLRRRRTAAALAPLNLLFEGDSTVAGTGASSVTSSTYLSTGTGSPGTDWPGLLVSLLRADGYTVTAYNTAVGGSTMTDVNNRAATDDARLSAAAGAVNYIFLLEGYNDASTAAAAQPAWFTARKAAGWHAVGCTPFANITTTSYRDAIKAAEIANASSLIGFYDLARLGSLTTTVQTVVSLFEYPWTVDNVHPNDWGYAVLAAKAYMDFRVNGLGLAAKTVVTHFWPIIGESGTSVVIYGSGFTGATAVTFNGVAATSFTVNSDTQITATVPVTTTGGVRVTSPTGSWTSLLSYQYAAASTLAPSISSTSVSPNAFSGSTYTINGSRLNGLGDTAGNYTASITFGPPSAPTLVYGSGSGVQAQTKVILGTVVTSTQVKLVVPQLTPPQGANVAVALTTPFGTASTTFDYATPVAPTISSIAPNPITRGANSWVTVNGTGFADPALAVTVNGQAVTVNNTNVWVYSNIKMDVRIASPIPTGTGTLVVTNNAGSASTAITVN